MKICIFLFLEILSNCYILKIGGRFFSNFNLNYEKVVYGKSNICVVLLFSIFYLKLFRDSFT